MTEQSLIPTAQIVFDAFWRPSLEINLESRLSLALAAAVDQVLPAQPEPNHCTDSEHSAWFAKQDARKDFINIINSLNKYNHIKED